MPSTECVMVLGEFITIYTFTITFTGNQCTYYNNNPGETQNTYESESLRVYGDRMFQILDAELYDGPIMTGAYHNNNVSETQNIYGRRRLSESVRRERSRA